MTKQGQDVRINGRTDVTLPEDRRAHLRQGGSSTHVTSPTRVTVCVGQMHDEVDAKASLDGNQNRLDCAERPAHHHGEASYN